MSRLKYLKAIEWHELSFERISAVVHRRVLDIPHWLSWHFHTPHWQRNHEALRSYKNKHRGERCFIIANGPSIRKMNLSLLKNEFTIGMNRIYLNAETMGFLPTFLVVFDVSVQIRQFAREIERVETTKFLNWNGRRYLQDRRDVLFFRQTFKVEFSTDLSERVHGGHSVTNVCLQLAYYLGFREVILIGKDHYYAQQGVPGQLVTSTGREENHFIKGYYKEGMVWRIPDYKGEELMYRMAREAFERDNRKVLDATVGGKLEVFDKVDYHSLF